MGEMRATIKRLTEELATEKKLRALDVERLEIKISDLKELHSAQVASERSMREAAQRGLVPYVRAVEGLNAWLKGRPELQEQLKPILMELGLWRVTLGYDPDEERATAALAWTRRA